MDFPHLLARLTALLQQRRPAYYATLLPPATVAELAAFEAEFNLTLPPELRAWWGWHNGQQGFESLYGSHGLQSVSSAAETMRVNFDLLDEYVPNWWRMAWVPVLENGGGDHICLDTEGTFTGQPGQLVEHWHDWESRTVLYPNLTAWLAAVVSAYEETDGPLTEEQVADLELDDSAGFPQEFEAG
ncbi:MAG: SMI1/KNR4 family protein [Janthinobacterium lividum]